jgi:hypothetical protein
MGKVLKWLKVNRIRLMLHFSTKRPACTPPTEWWLIVIIIQALVDRIEITFSAMQGMKTLVCEQRQLLTTLAHDIQARCNIEGPMTNEEIIEFSSAVTNDPLHGFLLQNYLVKKQAIVDSIDEVGGFVQISMDELRSSGDAADIEKQNNIISTIANFALRIVVGVSKVCAERDITNSSADDLPPVLPLDLCAVLSRDFISCLQQQRIRLKQNFSDADVEKN